MASYFFDSSALVKRYHAESGTGIVDDIVNATGSMVRISRVTIPEVISAFAIKVRTLAIRQVEARAFLRQFRSDIASGRLEVFSIAESEFAQAESLLERYAFGWRLRAFDAIQLAVALELHKQNLVDYFVAADGILCEVAGMEGFEVINPAQSHPGPTPLVRSV